MRKILRVENDKFLHAKDSTVKIRNNYKLGEKFVAYLQMLVHLISKILLQNFETVKVKVTK